SAAAQPPQSLQRPDSRSCAPSGRASHTGPGLAARRAQGLQAAYQYGASRTGLHADQTAGQIGKTPLKLLPRTLQLQNNCTALIEPHQVERVLADIDADCGDCRRR